MPKGPLGGPRPGATPEGEIIIYFEDFIPFDNLESLREAVVKDDFPLLVLRQTRADGDDTIVFKMDGEAITLETMEEIKEVADRVTETKVEGVELVFS